MGVLEASRAEKLRPLMQPSRSPQATVGEPGRFATQTHFPQAFAVRNHMIALIGKPIGSVFDILSF